MKKVSANSLKRAEIILEKYKACINKMTSIAEKEAFVQSIKLGIKSRLNHSSQTLKISTRYKNSL